MDKTTLSERNDQNLPAPDRPADLQGLQDVDVKITVEWGRSEITVADAVSLSAKSMLRTDKLENEPVDILVNGKLFGRGSNKKTGGGSFPRPFFYCCSVRASGGGRGHRQALRPLPPPR